MIPKKHRLSKKAEVVTTTARGRSFFSQSFILKALPAGPGENSKLTVITSVKVSKSAVTRNRIKRIIREALYEYLPKLKSGKYAIIVKQSAVKQSSLELMNEVKTALQKSKIIKA